MEVESVQGVVPGRRGWMLAGLWGDGREQVFRQSSDSGSQLGTSARLFRSGNVAQKN